MRLIFYATVYLYAAWRCLHAFTLGAYEHRGFIIDVYRKFRSVVLPEVEPSQIIDNSRAVHVHHPVCVRGNPVPLEMLVINGLAVTYRPETIMEIGTFDGRTTLNLAANTDEHTIVYTLDLPCEELESTALPLHQRDILYADKPVCGSKFRGSVYEKKIVQLYGDSARFDFSPYYGKVDMVFVDGAHSYEYVLNDSAIALKLLRDGHGIILWHDYSYFEVVRALDHMYKTDEAFGDLRHIKGTSLALLMRGKARHLDNLLSNVSDKVIS